MGEVVVSGSVVVVGGVEGPRGVIGSWVVAKVTGAADIVVLVVVGVVVVVVVIAAIVVVGVVMTLIGLDVGGAEVGSLNWGREEEERA